MPSIVTGPSNMSGKSTTALFVAFLTFCQAITGTVVSDDEAGNKSSQIDSVA